MVFKAVVLCVFSVLGQSIAGSCYRNSIPSRYASNRFSVTTTEDSAPVYSSEGISLSQAQSSYNPITSAPVISENAGASTLSQVQSSYKPIISGPVISENGRTFTVTSVGRIAPAGIAVAADLGLSGQLEVTGEIPYLSAVAFEGQFDTNGSSGVSYGCGDGCIAITEEFGKEGPTYSIPSLGSGGSKY